MIAAPAHVGVEVPGRDAQACEIAAGRAFDRNFAARRDVVGGQRSPNARARARRRAARATHRRFAASRHERRLDEVGRAGSHAKRSLAGVAARAKAPGRARRRRTRRGTARDRRDIHVAAISSSSGHRSASITARPCRSCRAARARGRCRCAPQAHRPPRAAAMQGSWPATSRWMRPSKLRLPESTVAATRPSRSIRAATSARAGPTCRRTWCSHSRPRRKPSACERRQQTQRSR